MPHARTTETVTLRYWREVSDAFAMRGKPEPSFRDVQRCRSLGLSVADAVRVLAISNLIDREAEIDAAHEAAIRDDDTIKLEERAA